MPGLVLTGALVLAAGCAHESSIPEALAARPLLPPRGSGRVALAGGAQSTSVGVLPAVGLGLDLGLGDHVAILDVTTLGFGGALDERWSLVGLVGIVDLSAEQAITLEASSDPRRPRVALMGGSMTLGGGLKLSLRPDERLRLTLTLVGGPRLYSLERVELFLRQSLLFTIDLSDSVGVSLGIDLLERSRPGAGVSPAYVARIGAPLWHAGGFDLGAYAKVGRDEVLWGAGLVEAATRF